ncbi:MAG: DegT/DnrJ/EryC1/StrS aminotransferase family protein [Rhodospirillaceae bacterium]|nr:MAG: DegT/DnrJ/EryC1/StrS aminotransferase family protein [Rhodospirillaceae bacterium]
MTRKSADSRLASWPVYEADEIAAVTAVLRSGHGNYWTGNEGHAFEREYAAHCGVAHGLAVANGTVALELALYGLDIGPGDEVIVPAKTFIATAAAVVQRGARPVVADIDPLSQNLTAATVAAALSPRTRAIIAVHLAGWPVDMKPLMELAHTHHMAVIEDCAQANGAADHGRAVGGIGHVGCFSFCQDKIISTGGEGGMVVTADEQAYRRMWAFRDHGKDFQRATATETTAGFQFLVDRFGTNWRMTEMQAAIGRVQLQKLPGWVARRRHIATVLSQALGALNAVKVPDPPDHAHHSFYKFVFQVDPAILKDGWDRDRIIATLEAEGIPARVGGCPDISREAAFAHHGFATTVPHPGADWLAQRTIMLPVHPTLTDGNVAFLAETTRDVIRAAVR